MRRMFVLDRTMVTIWYIILLDTDSQVQCSHLVYMYEYVLLQKHYIIFIYIHSHRYIRIRCLEKREQQIKFTIFFIMFRIWYFSNHFCLVFFEHIIFQKKTKKKRKSKRNKTEKLLSLPISVLIWMVSNGIHVGNKAKN